MKEVCPLRDVRCIVTITVSIILLLSTAGCALFRKPSPVSHNNSPAQFKQTVQAQPAQPSGTHENVNGPWYNNVSPAAQLGFAILGWNPAATQRQVDMAAFEEALRSPQFARPYQSYLLRGFPSDVAMAMARRQFVTDNPRFMGLYQGDPIAIQDAQALQDYQSNNAPSFQYGSGYEGY
ncbi:hypothetical protein PT277_06830 [Acetobacteraceae bacterium ESL0709]|nr:hypothetical protein [Acetobacteraceae bacterium ESL0697]MDF7678409.1 hypothetical protein [Acetobacteraceae bacterium ESL0709]